MARRMTLNLREIEVFKPYSNEFPHDLLLREGLDDDCAATWLQAETLRVAKRESEVLGVYAMNRIDREDFRVLGVLIAPASRKQGLGRWLIGHAIGVAESKGGRRVTLESPGSSRIFARMGFERGPEVWTFDLIQE